jgi:hypothetical protein
LDMDKDLSEMARGSYGYGRWEAPYWFIGPEQGMGDHEREDSESALEARVAAWIKLGRLDLNDCRKFHCEIGEKNWHCKEPVKLQKTWTPLLLTMMKFLDRPEDNESLRAYQRDQWGMLDEETCVIELSGLAAPKLKKAKANPFLPERIEAICQRMLTHRPELVVMYGRMQWKSWNAIAKAVTGRGFPDDTEHDLPKTSFLVHGRTILCRTPHPSRPIRVGTQYLVNEYWTRLGRKLRDLRNHPCHST